MQAEIERNLRRRRFLDRYGEKGHRKRGKLLVQAQGRLLRLRANMQKAQPTPSEEKLWTVLGDRKAMGFKVERQVVIGGRYIADFFVRSRKLVIELDGRIHDGIGAERYDAHRDEWLAEHGYIVFRLRNDMLANLEAVVTELRGFVV